MKYAVRVFDFYATKCLSTEYFQNGAAADDYYYECIRLVSKFVEKGQTFLVGRYNDGDLMVYEFIKG